MRQQCPSARRSVHVAALAFLLLAGCDRDTSTGGSTPAAPAQPAGRGRPSPARARPASTPVADADVEKEVIRIVAEQTGVKTAELSRGTRLKGDLKTDELDTVELVMELEDTFGMSIPDGVAEKFVTVGDMMDYVRTARKKPA